MPDPSDPVLFVVGARPNFVKVAPVLAALRDGEGVPVELLHTGQHYDRSLSDAFMEILDLPEPRVALGVGSGSHAEVTAAVMVGVERELLERPYSAIVVPGDVNSTLGAALAAVKLGVPIVHLESGLRSGDWTMPEEINRVVVDRIADLLLVHSEHAIGDLAAEGIAEDRVVNVGNTMIDSLFRLLPAARAGGTLDRLGLAGTNFALVTLHRPALVDDPAALIDVLRVLEREAERRPVVFPVHPRTRARLAAAGFEPARIRLVEPLDYLSFIALEEAAALVITDSGGVQEETSALGTPCMTYRTSTERPVTITHGTNVLVGVDSQRLAALLEAGEVPAVPETPIPLWDGAAGPRAAAAIARARAAAGRSAAPVG
jgi:UDP-N-acetylglucosamine 2-epimerase (non-hydrolysing)